MKVKNSCSPSPAVSVITLSSSDEDESQHAFGFVSIFLLFFRPLQVFGLFFPFFEFETYED